MFRNPKDVAAEARNRRRRRNRRRAPAEGLLIGELAGLVGVKPRVVRSYVERGLLPSPDFRGSGTRYGREHLLRLYAIRAFRKERLRLDAIRIRLDALSPADLERFAPGEPVPEPAPAPPLTGLTAPAPA